MRKGRGTTKASKEREGQLGGPEECELNGPRRRAAGGAGPCL